MNSETEFTLYLDGFAYLVGLSVRICAWHSVAIFKTKRYHPCDKFIRYHQFGERRIAKGDSGDNPA